MIEVIRKRDKRGSYLSFRIGRSWIVLGRWK